MDNELYSILNSIMYNKKDFYEITNDKNYNFFMINKFLSNIKEYVLISNEMNKNSHLPGIMQYDFLKNILPKKRIKYEYTKKDKSLDDKIKVISFYYDINFKRANEYLKRISEEQYIKIKNKIDKGIKKNKNDKKIFF